MRTKFFIIGLLIGLLAAAGPFLFPFSKNRLPVYFNRGLSKKVSVSAVKKADNIALPIAADIFLASGQDLIKPARNWNVPSVNISARTALVYETSQNNILFEKNGINEPRPIASMTKMMTALIVLDNAKLDQVFVVSKNAVDTEGQMGNLVPGEKLTVDSLLKIMLIDSSNDAAVALAENLAGGQIKPFVDLMNKKALSLGLKNTFLKDPSGLSPDNKSTAWELTQIMEEVLKSSYLAEIMRTSSLDITSFDGHSHHLVNTDKLLSEMPDIIAGKTGYTQEAGNCLILAVKSPYAASFIISVVMDAQDRLAETRQLIEWTKTAFVW